MADIDYTTAQVAVVYPGRAEIYDFLAGATIEAGQAVYQTSTGTVGLADANGSGTLQFRGIALTGGGSGQAISVLKRGHVYGFDLSALDEDALLYLSDTAGDLSSTVGSTTINCGRVTRLTDANASQVAYIEADWLRDWS